MDIAEFLTARFDEEQELAEAAAPGPWHVELLGGKGYPQRISNAQATVIGQTYTSPTYRPAGAEHMAYWNPARVLANLAAKRVIVGAHLFEHECADGQWYAHGEGCRTVRRFCALYAKHPDHEPDWAVDA